MDIKLATDLLHKIYFVEDGSDCWIPETSTRSIRHGNEFYSIVYLSYVISGRTEPFRKRQHVARICDNSNCFNPEHLLFGDIERFLHYTTKDENGCWNWNKSKDGGGYGVFLSRKYGREKVHRLAYMEWVGKIPDGLFVLHKCDNRKCCNPEHLFLGTQQDNVDDMIKKGRAILSFRGEQSAVSVLKERDVISIRRDYDSGMYSYRQLVEKYGVSQTQIARIVKRESWSWLTG